MSGQGSVADHPVAENIGLHHDVWRCTNSFRIVSKVHLYNSSTLTSTNVWSGGSCCDTTNPSLASRCTSLEEVSMLLHEDMNASFEAFTSNVSRCACRPSWSIARIASQPPCGCEMYLEESPLCGSRFVQQPFSSIHQARSGCQAA